jgi:hypothetical protein
LGSYPHPLKDLWISCGKRGAGKILECKNTPGDF